jgi:CBS domain-containing protein
MQVKELMTTPALSCRTHDLLSTPAQLMWDNDCGAITVLGDDGQLAGIITDRDICMAAHTRGQAPRDVLVADAMAHDVYTVRPEDGLETAERLMAEHQVRRMPVVDARGAPVGILTVNDLARFATSPKGRDKGRAVVDTLAAICRSRPGPQASAEVKRPGAPAPRPSAR